MFPLLRKFLDIQGGNPDGLTYDSNMGRKCLGKLCDQIKIPYRQSFESHGDLYKNWKSYQDAPENDLNFKRRTQSTSVDTAVMSLRRIARWMGRGRTVRADPQVITAQQQARLTILHLRHLGLGAEVNRILDS